MDAQQIPTADELQALFDLPAHVPQQDRVPVLEVLAFWGAVAGFLAVFWAGFFLGCSALWSAITG